LGIPVRPAWAVMIANSGGCLWHDSADAAFFFF
jgi:hypothetical protein